MLDIKKLYQLQDIDLKIGSVEADLADTKAKLSDRSSVELARRKLDQVEGHFDTLSSKRRSIERTVADIEATIKRLDDRLYGGSITNPQQLLAAEEERSFTVIRQNESEDKLLEIMLQIEELEPILEKIRGTLSKLEEERPKLEESWRHLGKDLETRLSMLHTERKEILPSMPSKLLPLYESIRKNKGGEAVSLVKGEICQGCHLAIPTQDIQRARNGKSMVQCSSCGRILFVVA